MRHAVSPFGGRGRALACPHSKHRADGASKRIPLCPEENRRLEGYMRLLEVNWVPLYFGSCAAYLEKL